MKSIFIALSKVTIALSVVTITLVITSFTTNAANKDEIGGVTCEGKKQAVQTQIDYAKKLGNQHQIQGLEKVLQDINNYCTNSDLETKYKKKVADKTTEVSKRIQELAQVQVKGNKEKIANRQEKLNKAEHELTEVKTKLVQFYKGLDGK